MKCIVAVDQNWGIGYKGNLLTHLPGDLKYFFKPKTLNKVVVMGRKTLESLPNQKPLVDRVNIVLTTDKTYKCDGAIICHSIEDVLQIIKNYPEDDVFIVGGESIYKQFLKMCDEIYVTKINKVFKADTYFPNLDKMKDWIIKWKSDIQKYPEIEYTWCSYEKVNLRVNNDVNRLL